VSKAGANAMRSVISLGFLIAFCASASAAGVHHTKQRRVISSSSPDYFTPSGARIYRDDSAPGGFRTDHDDPPSYDDPSRFGGG
jgi:hypothetical protein